MIKLNDFLAFFDFGYKKEDDQYKVKDLQSANLGDIESERFSTPEEIVYRFFDSIYSIDYIDSDLNELGYDGDETYESQYVWSKTKNLPHADIIYAFLHPENVTE